MKKSHQNTKKETPGSPISQEASQPMDTKASTTASDTTQAPTENNFFGIFGRLVCSPNTNISDDKSEIVFTPKTQPK